MAEMNYGRGRMILNFDNGEIGGRGYNQRVTQ
jgi:hypothetical protein